MRGMIAAPQPVATEQGARVLQEGGNAIDAAITTAFAQMIVDPQNCGIAGFGVANVLTADGTHRVIDFNGTAGSKASPTMWENIVREQDWTGYGYHLEGRVNDVGYQAIMTPGTVAGLYKVLSTYGTISWERAIAPAITLAEEGFLVSPPLWTLWNLPGAGARVPMYNRISATEGARQIYIKDDGSTYNPGERFRNPDYAKSLRRLAENGPDDFYRGELATDMVADFEQNDAFITADDLANYSPREEEPLHIRYRDYDIYTNPPAGGGICLAQTLKILERENIAAMGHNSVEYIDFVAHAMKAGYHDWYKYVADPEFVDVDVETLTSDSHAARWYDKIKARDQFDVPRYPEPRDTTHVTVADRAGNVISLTHSLGSSSGVVTPGLGFMYNNVMNAANPVSGLPNSIQPGKSRITGMCPTIVKKDGAPILALGAPGGTRIITGVLQGLLNVLDHGMRPQEAVDAARFDCQGETLDCEARIPEWRRAELSKRGFTVTNNPAPYGAFARVQAISLDPMSGVMNGGSDPRGGGSVVTDH